MKTQRPENAIEVAATEEFPDMPGSQSKRGELRGYAKVNHDQTFTVNPFPERGRGYRGARLWSYSCEKCWQW